MHYIEFMTDIRKENGHTQTDLAKALGWSRPQIARYETYKSEPTIAYLEAFCKFYKVSADRILSLPTKYK